MFLQHLLSTFKLQAWDLFREDFYYTKIKDENFTKKFNYI